MNKDFALQLQPDWKEMVRVNMSTSDFLASSGLHSDVVDTFTMVACELVENGIKYGVDLTSDSGRVELTVQMDGAMITVEVRNVIAPGSRQDLRKLDRTLQWIRGHQDPFQAYIERLKQISREPATPGRSGLGIVRIAYEARAAIDFIVGDDDTLSVSAVAKIAAQEGV